MCQVPVGYLARMGALALLLLTATFGLPPCGQPTIARVHLPGDVLADANTRRCRIRLDRRPHPWRRLCTIVEHELRHLHLYRHPTGAPLPSGRRDHHHSPDPRSIMAVRLTTQRSPRCPASPPLAGAVVASAAVIPGR
jgi:hypothetical protein